jgi:hypothetical protein
MSKIQAQGVHHITFAELSQRKALPIKEVVLE